MQSSTTDERIRDSALASAGRRDALGLRAGRLRAKPDKLLVYDQGQFFKSDKDTERADDIVGTLVVVLPSAYKGGSLLVRQRGASRRFLVRQPTEAVLSLFAFYASCEHEVRPVTKGQRVVLSHTLHFTPSASHQTQVNAEPLQRAIAAFFDAASQPAERYQTRPEKLAYLLDHEYSQRSLGWRHLKGADYNRAVSIAAASAALGLQTHLTLVNVMEVWSAYVKAPSYFRRRRGIYHRSTLSWKKTMTAYQAHLPETAGCLPARAMKSKN